MNGEDPVSESVELDGVPGSEEDSVDVVEVEGVLEGGFDETLDLDDLVVFAENLVALLEFLDLLEESVSHLDLAFSVEAAAAVVHVSSHVDGGCGIGLGSGGGIDLGALAGLVGRRERAEGLVGSILNGGEELSAICLNALVLEVAALFENVRALEGEQEIETPLLEPVGIGHGLGQLSLVVVLGVEVFLQVFDELGFGELLELLLELLERLAVFLEVLALDGVLAQVQHQLFRLQVHAALFEELVLARSNDRQN